MRILNCCSHLAVLVAISQLSIGAELETRQQTSPQAVAFGRYIASLERANRYAESGPMAVMIEASVPALYKESLLVAVRQVESNDRSNYLILGQRGDGAVVEEVVARYFKIQEEMEDLPRSSTLITPENYRFQFRGQVKTGGGSAHVYDVTQKKRRPGLFKGQIWIDAATGAELLVSGQVADVPSAGNSITFVRETTLAASDYTRVTHLTFGVPLLGRGELVVTERPLPSASIVPALRGSPIDGSQGALELPATPVY